MVQVIFMAATAAARAASSYCRLLLYSDLGFNGGGGLNKDKISATSLFWDANPCDGQDSFETRKRFRYTKEPWILPKIEEIARKHGDVLEIGCGQGVDGLVMCGVMPPGSSYVGLDLSKASLDSARQSAQQLAGQLNVTPLYRQGNAENLGFESESIESMVTE